MVQKHRKSARFSAILLTPVIYAAASSALTLAAEVDGGTFTFQRTRPVGWLNWLWGKMSWVVVSSLLLGLAARLETCVWQGVFPSGRDTAFALRVMGRGVGKANSGSSDSRMRQSSPKRHRLLLSPRRQGRIEKRNPYSASEYGFLFSDSSCVWGELASEPLTMHLLASTHASFG